MAITSNVYYPTKYLPCPLKDSFGLKPVSPLRRTDLTSGRARQRRKYTSTPTVTDIQWIFDDKQSQVFEAWFRDALKDGAIWFNMPLLTPIGNKNYLCRFTDIYEGPTPEGGIYWRYSAIIELWERPLPPVDWGNYPELLIGSDIIDIAINREWPQA